MTAIKVNRLQLIDALETAITTITSNCDRVKLEWEEYDKQREVFAANVLKDLQELAVKDGYIQQDRFGFNGYSQEFRIYLTNAQVKRAPKQPSQPRPSQREYKRHKNKWQHISLDSASQEKIEEIENTLKLLRMSKEESVNASVYKSVVQYL
jgi:hypothetical protein